MPGLFKKIPLRQIPELDTIRFLSILLVVLHHQFFEQNIVLSWFKSHGWLGVDIFFVMSGFLITSLLIKEIDKTNTVNLKGFWFRRMLRLWPSWIFTLLLSCAMVFVITKHNPETRIHLTQRWWHYFLHFGNYSHAFIGKLHTLFSHFWSLAVEEHFYLFWPLLLIFIKNRRNLILIMFALIGISFVFRFYYISQGYGPYVINLTTHTRIDEILFGCLLAFYFQKIKELSFTTELILTLLMFGLFYFALYFCKANSNYQILYALTYSICGLASCLLIVIALKGGNFGLRRIFRNPLLAKLGVLSYGVYLIHFHANFMVFSLLSKYPVVKDQNFIALINFLLPFVPAYYMYFYLDEYFARFKKH